LLVLAAFAGGLIFARPLSAGRFNPYQKLGVFTKVLSYIESPLRRRSLRRPDLMYGAARGPDRRARSALALHGPGRVRPPQEETEGNEEIEGIGIDVEKRKNRFVIISPIEGSPAAKAGIEPGDVIKRVDGVRDRDAGVRRRRSRGCRGPGGSEVTIGRRTARRELTFRIRRAKYEVKAVEGKMLEDGVGYIKLRVFGAGVDSAMEKLLDQFNVKNQKNGGLRGLVLDMRRNPAGCSIRGSASPTCSSPTG
jgi:carboxyl-terminal processing protease